MAALSFVVVQAYTSNLGKGVRGKKWLVRTCNVPSVIDNGPFARLPQQSHVATLNIFGRQMMAALSFVVVQAYTSNLGKGVGGKKWLVRTLQCPLGD